MRLTPRQLRTLVSREVDRVLREEVGPHADPGRRSSTTLGDDPDVRCEMCNTMGGVTSDIDGTLCKVCRRELELSDGDPDVEYGRGKW